MDQREKETNLRNWLRWLWRLQIPKSEGRLAGWRLREELMLQFKSNGRLLAGFPLPCLVQGFFSPDLWIGCDSPKSISKICDHVKRVCSFHKILKEIWIH